MGGEGAEDSTGGKWEQLQLNNNNKKEKEANNNYHYHSYIIQVFKHFLNMFYISSVTAKFKYENQIIV